MLCTSKVFADFPVGCYSHENNSFATKILTGTKFYAVLIFLVLNTDVTDQVQQRNQ